MTLGVLSVLASFSTFAEQTPSEAKTNHKRSKIATAIDSRNAEYTVDKHLTAGGEICGTTHENGHVLSATPAADAQRIAARIASR